MATTDPRTEMVAELFRGGEVLVAGYDTNRKPTSQGDAAVLCSFQVHCI